MKIFKAIVLSMVFVILVQCGPNKTTVEVEESVIPGMKRFEFNAINTELMFPEVYKKFDHSEFVQMSFGGDAQLNDTQQRDAIIRMFQSDPTMELLLDTTDVNNQIIVRKEAYFKPSKESSGIGLGIIKSSLDKVFRPFAYVEVVDSKLIRSSTTQILKGYFRVRPVFDFEDASELEVNIVHYLVSVLDRSYSVMITNKTGDDFEQSIKKMHVHN